MTPQWLEITLRSNSEADAERIEAALEAAGAIAITYTAADDEEIFEPPIGSMPLWAHTGITGLFPQNSDPETIHFLLRAALGNDIALNDRLFADSEWTRAWLDHFRPIDFGGGFWVAASEHHIDDPAATVLRLDPGLAFGTGTHPSTAMCLNWLVHHGALAGKTVYDYGCGSGILGIAAALLGAQHVWQTDIDPQALTASGENADKNGVHARITLALTPMMRRKWIYSLPTSCSNRSAPCARNSKNTCMPQAASSLPVCSNARKNASTPAYADAYHIRRADARDGWILLELQRK